MHEHADLVKNLGGGTKLAATLSILIGRPIDREAVYKWQNNGVAGEYRIPVARLLLGRGLDVPDGFLPEGLNVAALAPFEPLSEAS